MSDDEPDPWRTRDQRAGEGQPPSTEETGPLQASGWTSPSGAAPPPVPPAAAPPPYAGPTFAAPPPWSPAVPVSSPEPAPRGRLSRWVWPAIAALCLLLGIGGGLVGGALAGSGGDGSGGVLKVERRTAAPLPADNNSVAAVAKKLLPSTVQIIAEYAGNARGATGSGFVLDKQGHVITNNHVVAQAAQDKGNIEVVDQYGAHTKATVVGRSAVYDIAVLKVRAPHRLVPAKVGSSEQMRVGETVIAFGSPLGLSSTVTSGIVSALNRPVTTGETKDDTSYINAVQTDAAINPGNSGGPLVDLQGQVVGVNSAIATVGSVSNDQGGSIGVGFAIPIEQVIVTADQILRTGKAQYPVIGANVSSKPDVDGAEITSVAQGQPADDAGLRAGDLVTRIDGHPISNSIGLVVAIRSHAKGDKVELTVKRGARTSTVGVVLDARSD